MHEGCGIVDVGERQGVVPGSDPLGLAGPDAVHDEAGVGLARAVDHLTQVDERRVQSAGLDRGTDGQSDVGEAPRRGTDSTGWTTPPVFAEPSERTTAETAIPAAVAAATTAWPMKPEPPSTTTERGMLTSTWAMGLRALP